MTEAHVAGHSTHFLRRLDRVADQQVELALTLYRDPELLREVLRRARLADRIERVAISLEHDREGPFVVVTRDGRFVTCLGRGMRPTGLEVLTRAQLDAAAARVDRMRERLEQARQLEGELDRGFDKLLRKLTHAGPYLAREDFQALARWEPLLGEHFLDLAIRCNAHVGRAATVVAAIRERRQSSVEERLLEEFWYGFWARSHLLVLAHVGDPRPRVEAVQRDVAHLDIDALMTLTVHHHAAGVTQHSMRALWATARHARDLLLPTKHAPARGLPFRAMRDLSLAMIAHASKTSRAEALKALGTPQLDHPSRFERRWATYTQRVLLGPLATGTDAALADHRAFLAKELARRDLGLPEADVARLELRSPETYLSIVASSPYSWVCDPKWLVSIGESIPWLARCDAAQLFPTRATCEVMPYTEYRTEHGLQLAEGIRRTTGGGRPSTVRRAPSPLRNDRCPCGSGAKYKRCCAARPTVLAKAA